MATTVKEGLHNYTHRKGSQTTDTRIINLVHNGVTIKYKFSYRNYNAGEDFTGEIFDGAKLNHVFSIRDLGVVPDSSAYHIPTEDELKVRIEMLNVKGKKFIQSLY
jgi:hypothetical protein